jgi:membrane protein
MQTYIKQSLLVKQVAHHFIAAGQILALVIERLSQAKTTQLAASLTFTTVLSLVPLLAVILSVLTAFPLFKDFSIALQAYLTNNLMPPMISDGIMSYLNAFVLQASRLTEVGGTFLVLTVILLIMSIETAFNTIWRVERHRRITHRLLVYWAVITLGPVLAGASLYATASVMRQSLGMLGDTPFFLQIALKVLPVLIGALALAGLFIAVPNTHVNRTDALIGGLFASVLLELMKVGLSFYVSSFSTYTMIYGAFAALPVFLIYVYLGWFGILLGALVTANLPLFRLGRLDPHSRPGTALMDALSILKILSDSRGELPPGRSPTELVKRLRLPISILEHRLTVLSNIGLVALASGTKTERWLLACDPTRTTLGPLVDQLVLDRSSNRMADQPFVAQAISHLIADHADPTLGEVLVHYDINLTHPHPMHSSMVSSNVGNQYAKS